MATVRIDIAGKLNTSLASALHQLEQAVIRSERRVAEEERRLRNQKRSDEAANYSAALREWRKFIEAKVAAQRAGEAASAAIDKTAQVRKKAQSDAELADAKRELRRMRQAKLDAAAADRASEAASAKTALARKEADSNESLADAKRELRRMRQAKLTAAEDTASAERKAKKKADADLIADAKKADKDKLDALKKSEKDQLDVKRAASKADRDLRRAEREARVKEGRDQRAREEFWTGPVGGKIPNAVLGGVARYGGAAIGMARRVAGELARGYGYDTDLSSHMQRNVDLETAAVGLSNQAYQPDSKGSAGIRQSPLALQKEARDIGKFAAYDPTEVLGALGKYANKTGDLNTGRDILKDMAMLSKATGASLEDMVDAAADVANNLGNVEDKGAAVNRVMRVLTQQGKLGAVEIKDLASKAAILAAGAGQFEGSRERNIELAGAFTQVAREKGGAASAAQAATAWQSYVNQFTKGARIAGFKGLGIDIHSKLDKGAVRDVSELTLELLQKSHGDLEKTQDAIYDTKAKQVLKGFATPYREVYNAATARLQGSGKTPEQIEIIATAEATQNYRKELALLMDATITQREIQTAFAAAVSTTQSQVTKFNLELSENVAQLQTTIFPMFHSAMGAVTKGITIFADWVEGRTRKKESDADNAGTALSGALGAMFQMEDDPEHPGEQRVKYAPQLGPWDPSKFYQGPMAVQPDHSHPVTRGNRAQLSQREYGEVNAEIARLKANRDTYSSKLKVDSEHVVGALDKYYKGTDDEMTWTEKVAGIMGDSNMSQAKAERSLARSLGIFNIGDMFGDENPADEADKDEDSIKYIEQRIRDLRDKKTAIDDLILSGKPLLVTFDPAKAMPSTQPAETGAGASHEPPNKSVEHY